MARPLLYAYTALVPFIRRYFISQMFTYFIFYSLRLLLTWAAVAIVGW